ncbi:MAG TPA: DUF695 domain-containing protein [Thermoanaerobaculia bacterium]|nr:DUF695 domain-containing protein [Thermoanaerobaculia bacterium]
MKRIAIALWAALIVSTLAADTLAAVTPPNLGWATAATNKDGKFVVVRVRKEIPAEAKPAQYPTMIEMHWKYTPDAQGMPAASVIAQMAKLEAEIDPIQGDHVGYLMMTVTGNSERTWFWYVADPKAFGAALNRLIPGHPFPITLNADASEPDWKTYRAMREKIH